jgi:CheY-specific phosphatase CheX
VSRAPDRELLGAFLDDIVDVLNEACGVAAIVDEHAVSTGSEIAVIIHVHGDLSGVTWTFPTELARRLAEQMIPGVEPDPVLCEAAASELANMLTGRGLAALAARGVHIEIEPPRVIAAAAPGVCSALSTDLGTVGVVFHGGAS